MPASSLTDTLVSAAPVLSPMRNGREDAGASATALLPGYSLENDPSQGRLCITCALWM